MIARVASSTIGRPARRDRAWRAWREVLLYGLAGGLLIAVLKLVEYRFLVVGHSAEVYAGLVAVLFAALGLWLGRSLRGKTKAKSAAQLPAPPGEFARDDARLAALEITPRELEILGLIAQGLSNREIAGRLFVSENTVKTHSSRVFDKLGARRRTQAVQIARASRLIP
jgi:NarL family two-component system response regulator LiaR